MKVKRQKSWFCNTVTVLLLILMVFSLTGCIRQRGIQVLPYNNGYTLNLSPNAIVEVMRQAGFTTQQIIEHGEALHNEIAEVGGAKVVIDGNVEATFIANGNDLFITTMTRGLFIYNINTGWPDSGATQ